MGAIPGDVPFKDGDAELANWNLTEVDRMLLKQTDEEYIPHDWEELKWIVGTSILTRLDDEFSSLIHYSRQSSRAFQA